MANRNRSQRGSMSHFKKLPPVTLEFQNLTYTIQSGSNDSKLLLKSISGNFRSGQLSAIMGPSGSGKSTLLNVLAGYKTVGVHGTLMVNGRPLVSKEHHELSRYVMQEDLFQQFLTIQESMNIAVALKLNREISQEDKTVLISEILDLLRLTTAKDTLTNNLSGGERRRLSISLELISNPPVIFLDEPTTGLDDLSSWQCISLLKSIAEGGRTVICSLHTPSALMFQKFDNVYVMSEGLCVYQGYGTNVISFLSNLGLSCPKNYNPADFVIEVSSGQYGDEYVEQMSKAIENGSNESYCKDNGDEIDKGNFWQISFIPLNHRNDFFFQFKILLYRRFQQIWRNKQNLLLKVVASILMGICMGSVFFNIGQDPSKVHSNILYFCATLYTITFVIITLIASHFPPEIKLLQREHFNKWYGLTPYYFAMSLSTVPLHLVMVVFFIGISYVMSDQPMELDRFIFAILITWLVTLVAESHALLVSSIFNIINGGFIICVTHFLMELISIYGIGEGSNMSTTVTRVVMYFSYIRLGLESSLLVIYGYDRAFMKCPEEEIFCPLRDPKKVIDFAGFPYSIIWINIIGLVVWFFIFRIVGFRLLRFRLQTNNPIKSLKDNIQKLLNR